MVEKCLTIRQEHDTGGPEGATIYHLETPLSKGGEGPSWQARRVSPAGGEDFVALKAISDYWLRIPGEHPPWSDEEMRQRFAIMLEQHRRVRRIRSPGIAVADEVFCAREPWFREFKDHRGRHVLRGAVRPISVTAWIDGMPLLWWNKRHAHPLERIQVLEWLADALDEAHKSSELLRDVKPGNVVVDRDERAVYVDFGLTMRIGDRKTAVGGSGTEGYRDTALTQALPPGKHPEPSPRSDRFSFAALVLHQLTNHPPSGHEPDGHARRLLQKLPYPDPLITLIETSLTYPVGRPVLTASEFYRQVVGHLLTMPDQDWVIPGAAIPSIRDVERTASTA